MRSRPVALFFALALVITWVVWLPRAAGIPWAQDLGAVWSYGPAVAAAVAALVVGGRAGLAALGRRLTH